MSTHGCHSCPVKLQDYKGLPYEQTPCSTCKLSIQSSQTHKRGQLYDSDGLTDEVDAIDDRQEESTVPPWVPEDTIKLIKEACEANMMVTLSNVILRMVELSRQNPAMYQVLSYKMQHPELSYYDIGQTMEPPCSKQNVLYHLKHAVEQFPELASAIITDTRFSCGHYAIRTVADIMQSVRKTAELQHRLYPRTAVNTAKTVVELNIIFRTTAAPAAPITDFDAYKKDESALFKSLEQADSGYGV